MLYDQKLLPQFARVQTATIDQDGSPPRDQGSGGLCPISRTHLGYPAGQMAPGTADTQGQTASDPAVQQGTVTTGVRSTTGP